MVGEVRLSFVNGNGYAGIPLQPESQHELHTDLAHSHLLPMTQESDVVDTRGVRALRAREEEGNARNIGKFGCSIA